MPVWRKTATSMILANTDCTMRFICLTQEKSRQRNGKRSSGTPSKRDKRRAALYGFLFATYFDVDTTKKHDAPWNVVLLVRPWGPLPHAKKCRATAFFARRTCGGPRFSNPHSCPLFGVETTKNCDTPKNVAVLVRPWGFEPQAH